MSNSVFGVAMSKVQLSVLPVTLSFDEIRNCSTIYRCPRQECARLREGVPYAKVYRYNQKHVCPKLNSYGDNGQ